jgi:hypothetical protein
MFSLSTEERAAASLQFRTAAVLQPTFCRGRPFSFDPASGPESRVTEDPALLY